MSNKDAYYFSHDANAITDPKILAMRCDYGMEGYGLYWAIIEMMRNEECYKLNYEKNTFRAIKSLTNTNIDVDKFVDDCVNDYELFKLENNKLFSNSLLRRMEEYDHKKAISRENGKKGGAPKGNQNAKNSCSWRAGFQQNHREPIFLHRQNVFHQRMVGKRGYRYTNYPSEEIWKNAYDVSVV